MKTTLRIALTLLILPILAAPAFAQVNLEGNWDLQASGVIPPEEAPELHAAAAERGMAVQPCVFEGSGNLVQNGNQLTGTANLTLISGPEPPCPPEMMADVMGTVDGSSFGGMLDGGQMFGGLNFVGTISQDGQSIVGTYDVKPNGPFSNVTNGSWTAALQLSILQIPTLGAWGMGLLAALLALTSLLFLRRVWA